MSAKFHEEAYDDSIEESSGKELSNDEITPEEEGFMKGYDSAYEEDSGEEEIDKEFE